MDYLNLDFLTFVFGDFSNIVRSISMTLFFIYLITFLGFSFYLYLLDYDKNFKDFKFLDFQSIFSIFLFSISSYIVLMLFFMPFYLFKFLNNEDFKYGLVIIIFICIFLYPFLFRYFIFNKKRTLLDNIRSFSFLNIKLIFPFIFVLMPFTLLGSVNNYLALFFSIPFSVIGLYWIYKIIKKNFKFF